MRLVSQDGMIDVNYDNGSLVVGVGKYEECISAIISYYDNSCQKGTKLAEYSTKAKVLKVMEMLRDKYASLELFKTTYQEGVLKSFEKEFGFDETLNSLTSIFQFPKDEEVEV